jgi:hypothetical protein
MLAHGAEGFVDILNFSRVTSRTKEPFSAAAVFYFGRG